MTPVDPLRAAARLMRERAEAATPGPWEPVLQIVRAPNWPDVVDVWVAKTDRAVMELGDPANAAHIASWDPQVALAVADWLDSEADWTQCAEAVAVARAYLGGEE